MHERPAGALQAVLRPFRHFVSNDLEQTRSQISSVFCPHSLVPNQAAKFHQARMDLLRVSGLGMGTLYLGGAMSVDVPAMSDCYLMILCLTGSATIRTEGNQLTVAGKRGFICNPSQRFQAIFSADAEQLFLRIDRGMLLKHTGAGQLRMHSEIDLGRPALAATDASILMLLSNPSMVLLMQDNPRVAQEYEQLLLSLLLAGQPHVDEFKARRASTAPATVRRAEDFIRANAVASITLNDIAAASGVPVRTLLDGFRRFRGISPMRMLQDVRLELARHELLRENQPSVAAVAMSCGFGHLGRFAQSYAERFGERPSETRARRR